MAIDVYLEVGKRRVFAVAVDWPGWARSGPTKEEALDALAAYGPRYAKAIKGARVRFTSPRDSSPFTVVERLKGNATTDFGAPGVAPKLDARPLDARELQRQTTFLEACWSAFDAAAKRAVSKKLSTGPRGGGRTVDKMVGHVLEADAAYLHGLGGSHRSRGGPTGTEMKAMRKAFTETLASRGRGETIEMGRRTAPLWTPRYAVRRSAWHALDHAWEIEDRSRG